MDEITINVEGMTCSHCQMTVKKSLESLSGVKSADVNLENKSAVVHYKSNKVAIDSMLKTIENAGYKASV